MVLRTGWRVVLAVTGLILASVVALSVVAPSAAAQRDLAADPPKELWSEFPLNPKGERLVPEREETAAQAPFTPPAKAQAVPETPSESSARGFSALVAAGVVGALALLALLAVGAVRLREVAARRHRSAPLWQGTVGIEASPVARLQHYADVEVSVTQPARFSRGEVATRGGVPGRRLHLPSLRDPATTVRRLRRIVWNDSTAPFFIGCAIAIVAAFLITHLVG